jgi:hypothetical protein
MNVWNDTRYCAKSFSASPVSIPLRSPHKLISNTVVSPFNSNMYSPLSPALSNPPRPKLISSSSAISGIASLCGRTGSEDEGNAMPFMGSCIFPGKLDDFDGVCTGNPPHCQEYSGGELFGAILSSGGSDVALKGTFIDVPGVVGSGDCAREDVGVCSSVSSVLR